MAGVAEPAAGVARAAQGFRNMETAVPLQEATAAAVARQAARGLIVLHGVNVTLAAAGVLTVLAVAGGQAAQPSME